jgi:hypothetical protein
MVKKVTGFLAADGRFFDDGVQCEAYDAQEGLKEALAALGIKEPQTAFVLIQRCREQIFRYLTAISHLPEEEIEETEDQDNDEGELGGTETGVDEIAFEDDDNIGEEDERESEETQSIQPLPPGVRKPMSDLGSYIQPTPIRHQRKVNGPRGRQPNARDLRNDEDLAATPRRPAPKARRGDR